MTSCMVVHNPSSLSVLGYAVKTLLKQAISSFFPLLPSFPSLSFPSLHFFPFLSHLLSPRFSSTQLQAAVKKIYDEYISPTSPRCINVDDKVQKAVESKLNNPPLNIFSEAQEQVRGCTMSSKESSFLCSFLSCCPLPALFISPFPFLSPLFPILLFYTLFSLPWDPNGSCLITFLSVCYYNFLCAIATNYPLLPWPL